MPFCSIHERIQINYHLLQNLQDLYSHIKYFTFLNNNPLNYQLYAQIENQLNLGTSILMFVLYTVKPVLDTNVNNYTDILVYLDRKSVKLWYKVHHCLYCTL